MFRFSPWTVAEADDDDDDEFCSVSEAAEPSAMCSLDVALTSAATAFSSETGDVSDNVKKN